MKVEVSRKDVNDAAAMLKQLEQWEQFLAGDGDSSLLLRKGKLEVIAATSNAAIHQLENHCYGDDRAVYTLKVGIAKLCAKHSQALAKEVCELIRNSMPLPLEQCSGK